MLVAVPSESPGGLEARISDHFGHCDVFTMVQVEEQQVESVSVLPNGAHEGGQCMAPVMLLKEQGAEALVAGGMGQRPLSGFQQVGISVYFKEGAETVRDAIELDRVALVAFRLTDAEGELIDSADGTFYLHGHGQVLPGLEKALEGLVAGERAKATIPPEEGYGERDESRVIQAPTKDLPEGLAPGATVQAQLPNGGIVPMTVVAIDGPTATLDGNHPLAGKTIIFDVEVREVYAATEGDLAHGHVH